MRSPWDKKHFMVYFDVKYQLTSIPLINPAMIVYLHISIYKSWIPNNDTHQRSNETKLRYNNFDVKSIDVLCNSAMGAIWAWKCHADRKTWLCWCATYIYKLPVTPSYQLPFSHVWLPHKSLVIISNPPFFILLLIFIIIILRSKLPQSWNDIEKICSRYVVFTCGDGITTKIMLWRFKRQIMTPN